MHRPHAIAALQDSTITWDVIIIGGGASGLGAAVDASVRGYKTLLIEKADFAQGTSSRSTKLVHGGVRYLQQAQIKLVYGALRERGYLLKNAPHVAHALPFIIPCYRWWEKPFYGIGLTVYDLMAGRLGIGHTRVLSKTQTLHALPTLQPKKLKGGVRYQDGQFDDARLAIDLAHTAWHQGAILINYVKACEFIKKNGRICGILAKDVETGTRYSLKAKAVLNATGVFCDSLRKEDDPQTPNLVTPSQGIHLVLPADFLRSNEALMIPSTEDGRVLFAIPWHGRTLLGTTDTERTLIEEDPKPLESEIEFLLKHAGRYLTRAPQRSDVLSIYAGLRPLVSPGGAKATKAISRDHTVVTSSSGLVTLTGGKWTTYRAMAEDAINHIAKIAGLKPVKSPTKSLMIYGAQGEHTRIKQTLCDQDKTLNTLLHPDFPYTYADVAYAIRYEMARTVNDVLSHRTRCMLLDERLSLQIAPKISSFIEGSRIG